MRSRATAAATLCLALAAAGASAPAAYADDDTVPTRAEVHAARAAVTGKGDQVASVQAAIDAANERLRSSSIAAAQAAEAFNGARYEAGLARAAARAAAQRETEALADVERLREVYASSVVTSVQSMPTLNAMTGVMESDGILDVLERMDTMRDTETALDSNYDEFRAASAAAAEASDAATAARADAERTETAARAARDLAQNAADSAAAQAQAVAEEKTRLLAEIARLQDISVGLAERRQAGLEATAAEAAAADQVAAPAATDEAAEEAAQAAAPEQDSQQAAEPPATEPPAPEPAPQPAPAPTPAADSSGGARAAIAFARAQIGEPYVWGAAGPGSWDCSGLTMAAWQRGGVALPHYSVAQYEASTPVSAGDLQPGDLAFWGSSSSPSSIYHVALYLGDGRMIHAPRTGRPVVEESLYYWTAPNFFARP
ncbi:C40 family peptidase [Nocardioides sp. cx-173]|uniref:C40 family peptidase n=1 Tax=Nocardioides sp. cx-173 TaxID=2898796 RepID=UPI001E64DB7C|nr:C40 family peptidase [Nocardioides sp. cx-173]MCD4523331.1 C40 family peptidase [Nocardioides sp. cx-173]UGB42329.1 C40 family peptidase [Nocardioides sp. cx-173]